LALEARKHLASNGANAVYGSESAKRLKMHDWKMIPMNLLDTDSQL